MVEPSVAARARASRRRIRASGPAWRLVPRFARALVPLLISAPAAAQDDASDRPLAIENVVVIDVDAPDPGSARAVGRTVIVRDGRIAWVGPAAGADVPRDARRIDAAGGFLIPGMLDMHVHFNRDTLTQRHVMAPLMIANGVTGARDLLSDCWEPCSGNSQTLGQMRELQAAIERGEVLAPRLLALSSPIVHGPAQGFGYPASHRGFWRPGTEEEGRELVRFLSNRGVDFVKIYTTVPRAAFFGLMNEARTIGLPVAGHLPWSVRPEEAARAGLRSIEHARFPGMACNPAYERWREGERLVAEGGEDPDPARIPALLNAAVSDFDPAECERIVREIARAGTYLVPTLVTRQMDARAGDSTYRSDPRRKYVPAARLRGWDRDLDATSGAPEEVLRYYRRFFDVALRVTGMAHEAGVPILVGTDVFDTMVFPGFSYHDELELLARAGLGPLELLRAATLSAAEFLGLEDRLGAVAPGFLADLVLLDADPLEHIANTGSIRAVIFGGRLLDREELDGMIDGVETTVRDMG